jgi:hypothetical protein
MEIVHDYKSIPLTSAEIGYLWLTYLLNSKSKNILMYAVETADDPNIKEIMQNALEFSGKNLKEVKAIFETVNHPLPYGFSEFDVKLKSGKLYSDKLMLQTLKLFISVGISQYGYAIAMVARSDVKNFFNESMQDSLKLLNKIDNTALSKGIFVRPPNIPIPKKIEIAEDKSIMGRFIGHRRPMTALEVASVFNASLSNYIVKANILGLAQTMKDDRIRDFYDKVTMVLKEHTEDLNIKLHNENLSTPVSFYSEILNSTEAPFSDRLSFYFAYSMLGDLLGSYAASTLNVMRKDLTFELTRLNAEVFMLAKDATNIMIDKGWYEEMPKNVDREDIIDSNEEDKK